MNPIRRIHARAAALSLILTLSASGQSASPPNDETVVLEAFQVTGSNLSLATEENSLPMTTMTAADMEALGASNLADIIAATPYSQNISFNETATGPNDARGDVATINLRNLGAGRTLTLLNGRRMSAHGVTPGTPPVTFVNLNQIPFAAVRQVEILRDGASAIYGSDAIGGVLNTRLRRDFTGSSVSVRYANASPDPDEFNADIATGFSFNDDATNIALFLSYFRRTGLRASDRVYAADADKRLLVDEPYASNSRFNRRSSSGPQGRFTALDDEGDPVAIDGFTGSSGSSRGRFYVDPDTGEFGSGSGPSAFYNFQEAGQLIPSVDRRSFFGTLNHKFTTELSLFAEVSYYDSYSSGQTATTPISGGTDGVVIPRTNYYNPVGARFYGPGTDNPDGSPRDVLIRNYRSLEIGPRWYSTDMDSYRIVSGLRGRLPNEWNWESALLHMSSETYQVNGNYMSQSLLEQQLALPTPEAFNPFAGVTGNEPAQFQPFVIDIWDKGTSQVTSWDGRVSGDLLTLMGNPVPFAFGAETRRESMRQRNDSFGLADDVIAQSEQIDIDAARNVYAVYAEALAPLVKRADGANLVEVRVAGRYENYDKFDAFKPSVAASVRPADFLLLRASYNEGFRAPGVAELFQPQRDRRNNGLIDDARSGREDAEGTVSKRVVTGGNPDLQPEESKSYNLGFVVDIKPVNGLSLSLDYYSIELENRIDNPDPQDELDNDNVLWELNQGSNPRVIREARTDADITDGIPGRLIEVRGIYNNFDTRKAEGFDVGLAWLLPETDIGRFSIKADVAYTLTLEDTNIDGIVGELLRQGANPRVKSLLTVSWRNENWSAAASGSILSDYENSSAYDSPRGDPDAIPLISDDTWIFNASVGYAFAGAGILENASVRLGVNNLTDVDPPLYLGSSSGYDASYFNAKGRQWYLSLVKKF